MMHLLPSFHPEVGNHINHTARHLSEGTKQLVLLTSFMPIRFILKATSKSHKNVSAIKATNDWSQLGNNTHCVTCTQGYVPFHSTSD